ncbi:MAG: helix-turn-helix transcriptional regulator [Pseudomonadota bacterium]
MTKDHVVDLTPVKTPEQLLKEEVGLYLKIVRETQGKPLRWVAQKLGVSNSFISQIEKGARSDSTGSGAGLLPCLRPPYTGVYPYRSRQHAQRHVEGADEHTGE